MIDNVFDFHKSISRFEIRHKIKLKNYNNRKTKPILCFSYFLNNKGSKIKQAERI